MGSARLLGPGEVDRQGYSVFERGAGAVYLFRHLRLTDGDPACPAVGEAVEFRGSESGSFDMSGIVAAVSCWPWSDRITLVAVRDSCSATPQDIEFLFELLKDTHKKAVDPWDKRMLALSGQLDRLCMQVASVSSELRFSRVESKNRASEIAAEVRRNRSLAVRMLEWLVRRR